MSIYIQIMDHVNQEKKYSMSGQMSLFDLVGEEEKADFQIRMPDVGEYSKENKRLIKSIVVKKSNLVKITTYDLDNRRKELEFDNENRKNSSYTADVSFGNLSFVLKNKK